jgi:hypothetical protein
VISMLLQDVKEDVLKEYGDHIKLSASSRSSRFGLGGRGFEALLPFNSKSALRFLKQCPCTIPNAAPIDGWGENERISSIAELLQDGWHARMAARS